MPSTPASKFVFQPKTESESKNILTFSYRIDFTDGKKSLEFTEQITFPESANWTSVPAQLAADIYQALHILLGISYYKLYIPPVFEHPYELTAKAADFWNLVYSNGLGEFLYQNQLKFEQLAVFQANAFSDSANTLKLPTSYPRQNRSLLGIGGGKDSIIAAELMRKRGQQFSAYHLETGRSSQIIEEVIQILGSDKVTIKRQLDCQIFESHPDSFNGHLPISAVFALLGLAAATVMDYRYVVVGNERSSSFGNLEYDGRQINHQWSKSTEFEEALADFWRQEVTDSVRYFSLLRPFWELQIVELLSEMPQYFEHFSSCNQVFKVHKEIEHDKWCCNCPKCAFVWLMLTAYLKPEDVINIFGQNLYEREDLIPLFKDLLGIGVIKPFECVGTFAESKLALNLAAVNFAETKVVQTLLPLIELTEAEETELAQTGHAPNLPSEFLLTAYRNCLILGYGQEGKVTEEYLQKYYPDFPYGIADQSISSDYLDRQNNYDLVVKTPGLPSSLVHKSLTGATNLFFAHLRRNYPNIKVIGVTGSKGKSTTSSLAAQLLETANIPHLFLGNIGKPMLSATLDGSLDGKDYIVLELSSYMLENLAEPLEYAIVTSLFTEHLDHHGTLEKYYNAKRNITAYQRTSDHFIFNPAYPDLVNWADATLAQLHPYNGLPSSFELETTKLRGEHNLANCQAIYQLAKLLNLSDEVFLKAVNTFEPLKHRLQNIGTYHGITFYDDAISTAPETAIMALRALENVDTIFLGGSDRGYDFTELEAELLNSPIRNIVLFPDTGARIISPENRAKFNILDTDNMRDAVEFAYAQTKIGSICLLSTASPSYSLWKNFEAKGDEFQKFVKEK